MRTLGLTAIAIGECGEEGAQNHDQASCNDGNLATPVIGKVWTERTRRD